MGANDQGNALLVPEVLIGWWQAPWPSDQKPSLVDQVCALLGKFIRIWSDTKHCSKYWRININHVSMFMRSIQQCSTLWKESQLCQLVPKWPACQVVFLINFPSHQTITKATNIIGKGADFGIFYFSVSLSTLASGLAFLASGWSTLASGWFTFRLGLLYFWLVLV